MRSIYFYSILVTLRLRAIQYDTTILILTSVTKSFAETEADFTLIH